jgi:hypothetical protein
MARRGLPPEKSKPIITQGDQLKLEGYEFSKGFSYHWNRQ